MTINENLQDQKITIKGAESFDISQILECGQCFRFSKVDSRYKIIAFSKVLFVEQVDQEVIFYNTTREDFDSIWMNYFDLSTDYSSIKKVLANNDKRLHEPIAFADGIRLLNQEPFECMISFIISQNKKIPMIKNIIKTISEIYGTQIDEDSYAFPTPQQLGKVSIDELLSCKTGFRAKYISDAVQKVCSGEIDFDELRTMPTDKVREKLMSVYGIGLKVADCIMLFSLGRKEVFPIDVWVKKIMKHYYFDGVDVNLKEITDLSNELYGDYAGVAQQYLFHYARHNPSIMKV